jgi:hypothetical protein
VFLSRSECPEILRSLPQAEAVVRTIENAICIGVILTVVMPETDLAYFVVSPSD